MTYRILVTVFGLILITSFTSCSSSEHSKNTISPFKVTNKSGSFELIVKNDGSLKLNAEHLGFLKEDGTFISNKGVELARLEPDGTKMTMSGKVVGEILKNGDLQLNFPPIKTTWNENKIQLREEYILVDAKDESKRWASFVLILFM